MQQQHKIFNASQKRIREMCLEFQAGWDEATREARNQHKVKPVEVRQVRSSIEFPSDVADKPNENAKKKQKIKSGIKI